MTKVILCCNAGMSTSLFVQKIQKHTAETGTEIDITAIPVADLENHLTEDTNVVALAPQIKFQIDNIAAKTDKPIIVIEMRDYGMMNAEKVLNEILDAAKS